MESNTENSVQRMEYQTKRVHEFSLFEEENHLFERTYAGLPYWYELRFLVSETVLTNRFDYGNAIRVTEASVVKPCEKWLAAVKKIVFSELGIFFAGKQELLRFDMNPWHERFYDAWNPHCRNLMLRTSATLSGEKKKKTYTLYWPYYRRKWERKKGTAVPEDAEERRFLNELEKKLLDTFGKTMPAKAMERHIRDYQLTEYVYALYYEKILKRTGCKAVTVLCYYNNEFFGLYKAARKCGVKIIELQHGVVSNHIEYMFENQDRDYPYVPDVFLAFGEEHIRMTRLPKSEKAIAVGSTEQERMLAETESVETDDGLIVIYPQISDKFEELLCEFIKKSEKSGYKVIVKLHPGQAKHYRIYYPMLAGLESPEFVTDQSKGIYYWLKRAKHHVMASTTVGMEAVSFDHTNVCIAEMIPHEQTQILLDRKVARGFRSAEELMTLIEHPYSGDREEFRRDLWKPDARENMEKEIDRILCT